MLFRQHKNELFRIIERKGFSPADFDALDDLNGFRLCFKNSKMCFNVFSDATMFRAYVTLHSPQYPVSETRFLTWNEITRYFDNWIDGHLRKHVEEIEAPDLWKEIASRETLSKGFRSPTIDNRPFTADEAVQIKFCLGEFRQALADELNPSKEQLDFINERLAYLESAIDRLNRFDWTSVLLSSCISIATNLTVDTSRGNMILDLLYRCFRSVLLIGS